MMKRILNKLQRNQRGVVLIIVLILLAVGGLTIAPMLSHMSTGLKAGQTYERKTNEYYAADAGVEDALWQITMGQRGPLFPSEEGDQWTYTIDDINGKSVAITIDLDYLNDDASGKDVYKIDSTATSAGGGYTTIQSYVTFGGGFAFLLDNAITSPGDVTLQPGSVVSGDVQYNGELDNKGTIIGDEITDPLPDWPTVQEFVDFYFPDVAGETPFASSTINLNGIDDTIGPVYRIGDLDINNSSATPAMLTLDGTIYITGDLSFSGPKAFMLDLNNQTIFVESPSADPQKAINFTDNCTISGSGCIIAVGDIYYSPKTQTGPDDFVLVMSIDGEILFQPQGDYYGCIVGNTNVNLQPGATLTYTYPPSDEDGGINFPNWESGDTTGWDLEVRTWEIS